MKTKTANTVKKSASIKFDEDKGNTLKLAKAAKKAPEHRAKLALVFQALKSTRKNEKETETKIEGATLSWWKSNPKKGDFDGVTVRFVKGEVKGVDRAILATIQSSLKSCGIETSAVTIRKGGSIGIFA